MAKKAWNRVFAKDAPLAERATAWGVANTMQVKRKFGMGAKPKKPSGKRKKKAGKGMKKKRMTLRQIVAAAKSSMDPRGDAVKTALRGAREAVRKNGGRKNIQSPRTRPVPSKIGGILPAFLIPLFAGLSATGALAGGAAGIAKAINQSKAAKNALEESKRHNQTMEAIALGKGLYLKPYKKGLGLHLYPKND